MIATPGTVGLAERIIDDTCLKVYCLPRSWKMLGAVNASSVAAIPKVYGNKRCWSLDGEQTAKEVPEVLTSKVLDSLSRGLGILWHRDTAVAAGHSELTGGHFHCFYFRNVETLRHLQERIEVPSTKNMYVLKLQTKLSSCLTFSMHCAGRPALTLNGGLWRQPRTFYYTDIDHPRTHLWLEKRMYKTGVNDPLSQTRQ